MGKYKLLIVESPTKAKTIQKYLGSEYRVVASKGHIKDLPVKELGVDVSDNFKMKIVPMKGKGDVIKEIKKIAENASEIFLGPDPDREGEAIAFHLKGIIKNKNIKRVLFASITKEVVQKSLANPLELDKNKYEAQKTRRVLDRLVGYKISPLICNALQEKVSAGRVQSVALRLIIEREQDIAAFIPDNWFNIKVKLEKDNQDFFSNYYGKTTKKKSVLENEEEAKKILEDIKNSPYILKEKEVKDAFRKPSPPFTTSKLQQEASKKLKFSTKQTMQVAQKLYEGIEITGEGTVGLITYMRTDSTRTDPDALKQVREYILGEYGDDYLEKETVIYGKKGKNSQDAHEAIRPSKLTLPPDKVRDDLDHEAFALYELIWNKFVSSQMTPSKYEQTTLFFDNSSHIFKTTGSVLIFDGFKKIFEDGQEEKRVKKGDEEEESAGLPMISEGDEAKEKSKPQLEAKQSSPPALFTESSLVEIMEKKGIGRPSTYSAIISNLLGRKYVEKKTGKFSSTELGRKVWDLLFKNFSEQMEVSFTSKIEKELDLIENGEKKWLDVMKDFWDSLNKSLLEAKSQEIFQFKNQKQRESSGIKCKKCESGIYEVVEYSGNAFLGCNNYPTCKSTQDFKKTKEGFEIVDKTKYHEKLCPKCESKLALRKGKFGEFWGCTNYPKCKYIQAKGVGPCPKCEDGEVLKRKGPKGPFWGCSNYNAKDKCSFTTNEKPTKKGLEEKKAGQTKP